MIEVSEAGGPDPDIPLPLRDYILGCLLDDYFDILLFRRSVPYSPKTLVSNVEDAVRESPMPFGVQSLIPAQSNL